MKKERPFFIPHLSSLIPPECGGDMLSDQFRQLLTAYVDGELSSRQRKAVQRLLRRSPEARSLLLKLQEDARRLRALPRHRLGEVFTARVVRSAQQAQV